MVKPGYKETEIGVIPEDWNVESLGEKCHFIGGGTPSKDNIEYWNGDIPWVSSSDLCEDDVQRIHIDRYITKNALMKSATQLCPAGSVLVVSRVGVGKVAVAEKALCTSQDFTNIVCADCNNLFLAYSLLPVMKELARDAQGTSIKGVTTSDIKSLKIGFPLSTEQAKIVESLSDIDNLIDQLGRLITKKKAINQGAMQELLTGKKRLAGFSSEWGTRTLQEVSSEMVDGPFGSNLKTEHYTDERQVRIIQLSNIGDAGWNDVNTKYTTFNHAAELYRCVVQPGAVLIAKMMPAGRAIICPDREKSYILGSDVVKVIPNDSIDSRYLVYATKSQFYLDQIADDTQGSTRSRTSVSKLRKTSILFPTKAEQTAIADVLAEMDLELVALERKLVKYRQIKQGMMQQLLTGKIRLM